MDMNSVIEDINSSLRSIVEELEKKQKNSDDSLAVIQHKIDEKIEEAKRYKVDVDEAKGKIHELEADIEALKIDLNDLNERFGNKDLSAIVEAGNREINGKILEKQSEINRYRDRISELTDRARTIKDLLVNLKKDKESKKNKLDSLTGCLKYYKSSINNIIEYSENNPDALENYTVKPVVPVKEEPAVVLPPVPTVQTVQTVPATPAVEDTSSPIFDEIEVLSGEDEKPKEDEEETSVVTIQAPPAVTAPQNVPAQVTPGTPVVNEVAPVESAPVPTITPVAETANINTTNDVAPLTPVAPVTETPQVSEPETVTPTEPLETIDSEKPEDSAINIFDQNNDTSSTKIDNLKALNDSIDKEYADIFGDNDAIQIEEQEKFTPQVPPKNIFDQNDLQEERELVKPVLSSISSLDGVSDTDNGPIQPMFQDVGPLEVAPLTVEPLLTANVDNSGEGKKVIFGEEEKPVINSEEDTRLVNFFTPLGIDYYSFKLSSQDYLKRVFNPDTFNKIITILKNNKISLDALYTSPNIFGESTPAELEHVIAKLISVGQSTQNIGYVLNTLPLINSFDLAEVIDSYGPLIKEANITDLIIKAKHLNDMGGVK